MADVAHKQKASVPGSAVREQLRTLDDGDVVAAFLGGEERAFQELVEPLPDSPAELHLPHDRRPREGRGPGAGGLHPRLPPPRSASTGRRSSRPGSTRSRRTWRRTSCATARATRSCSSRRSRRTGRTTTVRSSSRTRTSRPDDLYRKRHLRELVEETVAQLPEHHREVFVLRELEGKSYEEIAEITDCNLGTVKSRLNRARTAFAEIIEPLAEVSGGRARSATAHRDSPHASDAADGSCDPSPCVASTGDTYGTPLRAGPEGTSSTFTRRLVAPVASHLPFRWTVAASASITWPISTTPSPERCCVAARAPRAGVCGCAAHDTSVRRSPDARAQPAVDRALARTSQRAPRVRASTTCAAAARASPTTRRAVRLGAESRRAAPRRVHRPCRLGARLRRAVAAALLALTYASGQRRRRSTPTRTTSRCRRSSRRCPSRSPSSSRPRSSRRLHRHPGLARRAPRRPGADAS